MTIKHMFWQTYVIQIRLFIPELRKCICKLHGVIEWPPPTCLLVSTNQMRKAARARQSRHESTISSFAVCSCGLNITLFVLRVVCKYSYFLPLLS